MIKRCWFFFGEREREKERRVVANYIYDEMAY